VPKALQTIGARRITHLFWWQGETPTDRPELYPEHFDAVMARLTAEPWMSPDAPIAIFGVAPSRISKNPNSDVYNRLLKTAAAAPRRHFIDTSLFGSEYWRDTAHPNGFGFYAIGQKAAAEISRADVAAAR
jgi:hypothetical protein